MIPASRIDSASKGLLSLMPLPNQPGKVQNYQIINSVPQNSNSLGVRLSRSFSRTDRLSGSFNMQNRNGSSTQLYGFEDASSGRGMSADMSWTHTIKAGVINTARISFSRNRSDLLPYFAYGRNWAQELGIPGTSSTPSNYGPPNISFTNFGALSDGSTSQSRSQNISVNEGLLRVWKKHNFGVGFEYRRSQQNSLSQQNARGTLAFSGIATSAYDEKGFPLAGTGFDFADFLLGRPQSSSIRFGNADTYYRGSTYIVHGQDDWRVRSGLSLNLGVRYEVLRPLHEKYGRMANLDIAPGMTGVAVVTPLTLGPYTGIFPEGLIEADTNNIAPRFGFAWRPFPKQHLQVRGGYGIYYNGSISNQAANRLAQQPPFAKSGSLSTSVENPLSMSNAFISVPNDKISNTYAVDRFYRTGYAQTWNLAVQKDLPHSIVMEVGYLGTKGTRLDIQSMPNRALPGSPLTAEERRRIGNAVGFTFDSSNGSSIFHSGQLRVSRRFRSGMSANAFYTYGKSIDNASTIGGGGGTVAQDDHNLRAERALSSFDRRHNLNLSYMVSSSAGRRGAGGVTNGLRAALMKDWTLTGSVNIRSGSPFTAQVLGNRSDQGGTGSVGSGRADATGLNVSDSIGFFNPLAFTIPPSGRYGNAGRNTIHGPGFFSMNMSLGRTLHFKETRRSVDIRMEASNLLNSVNISRIGATVNASNYGWALDASSMRSLSANLRFRF